MRLGDFIVPMKGGRGVVRRLGCLWLTSGLLLSGIPPAQAQLMALPGKLEVTPGGAANYSIPIAVPPGTAGMAPTLGLTYSSQQGDGPLGVGWGLSGLPAVTRCPQTMVQDGVRGAVNYDSSDRFCLEGQRLMAVSGTYGADGTEYRTELEGFSKVVSRGSAGTGPAWFEVRTKAGQVMELGRTADSQVLAQGKTTARAWMTNKVSDTKGNYLTASYTVDADNGQNYPARIDYTGNTAAGLAPYNSVRFVYETRPDAAPAYHAGSLIKTTQRLSAIEAYVDAIRVNRYQIAYETSPSTQRSRITSITQCAQSGACLPATTLTWQDKPLSFPAAQVAIAGYGSNQGYNNSSYHAGYGTHLIIDPRFMADINGDGRADIFGFDANGSYFSISTGINFTTPIQFDEIYRAAPYDPYIRYHYENTYPFHEQQTTPRIAGDFDGDGLSDLGMFSFGIMTGYYYGPKYGKFTALYGKSNYTTKTYIAATRSLTGEFSCTNDSCFNFTDGFTTFGESCVIDPLDISCNLIPSIRYLRTLADIDGDGRSDVIGFRHDLVSFALSTGTGFTTPQNGPTGFTDTSIPRFAVDLNGDGKADLLGLKSDGAYVSLSTGTNFGTATKWLSEFGSSSGWNSSTHIRTLADVNGDGKPDLVGFKGDGVYVALNTGTSFLTPTRWVQAFGVDAAAGGWSSVDARPRQMVDVNGDGKADIVGFGIDGTYVALSTGTAFGTPTKWLAGFWAASGEWSSDTTSPRQFADVDGNGLPDIVGFGNAGTYVSFNPGPVPDLVTGITTGLGAVSMIAYKPLTDSAVYTKGSGAAYPVQDVQAPIYVVAQTEAPDGVGGTYKTAYAYAGAKNDLNGRGFLGFASVAARDLQTNVVETAIYRQDHPYIGLASARTKTLNALTLNQESLSYTATSLGGTRYFIGLGQSVAQSKDLSGTALPTVTSSYQYDAYGNPTQVVVATSDGASKTTTNTYTNDTANWLLGRLTAASVTSVTP